GAVIAQRKRILRSASWRDRTPHVHALNLYVTANLLGVRLCRLETVVRSACKRKIEQWIGIVYCVTPGRYRKLSSHIGHKYYAGVDSRSCRNSSLVYIEYVSGGYAQTSGLLDEYSRCPSTLTWIERSWNCR